MFGVVIAGGFVMVVMVDLMHIVLEQNHILVPHFRSYTSEME